MAESGNAIFVKIKIINELKKENFKQCTAEVSFRQLNLFP